ncbi:MFS transporter [Streptomyces sp. NPDC002513]
MADAVLPTRTTTAAADPADGVRDRRALIGGVLGYFVDQFDIYLPVVALAPAMAYFQPATLDAGTTALITAFIFTATLLGRPIGAAVFGVLADRVGRRRSTIIAIGGIGITTLAIGLLPGYETWGLGAVIALMVLRLIDGFFLGGEYTAAVPLAMEWSPKSRRGLRSSLITWTSPGAMCLISVITLLMLQVAEAGGPDSPYARWGWRIPFLIGGLMAFVFMVYFIRRVEESNSWEEAKGAGTTRSPLVELFSGNQRRSLIQVFVLMSGMWLATQLVSAVLPGLTATTRNLTSNQLTTAQLIGAAAAALSYPLMGMLSQRIGRRPFYLIAGALIAVVTPGGTLLITMGPDLGLGGVIALYVITFAVGIIGFGPIAAYLTERFPAAIRSTGYGIGYSLALVLPALYPYYLDWLKPVIPTHEAVAGLLFLAGLLIVLGAAIGPETRDVDI